MGNYRKGSSKGKNPTNLARATQDREEWNEVSRLKKELGVPHKARRNYEEYIVASQFGMEPKDCYGRKFRKVTRRTVQRMKKENI